MVEEIEPSKDLKDALPYGTLKQIAAAFGLSGISYVSDVISGKVKGNSLIIECAYRIAVAYEDCGFDDVKQKILEDYGPTYKARKQNS